MQTRKEFLKSAMTVAAISPFFHSNSFAELILPKNEFVYFDLHSHPGWNFSKKNFNNIRSNSGLFLYRNRLAS